MRVGDWTRYSNTFCCKDEVMVEKIKKFECGEWVLNNANLPNEDLDNVIIKTSPNIEDLLEVGDIVITNFQGFFDGKWGEMHYWFHNKLELDYFVKNYERYKKGREKIIKIIPHENLEWQEVENE